MVRRTGFDWVRFPGLEPGYLRVQRMSRLGVDLVVDVGANIGQYGQDLRTFGYQGKIVSFEPILSAFGILQAVSSADGSWSAVRAALGASSSKMLINIAGNSTSSSLLPMLGRHSAAAPTSEYIGTEEVPVDRLDVLAREQIAESRAPFLKIDTQGYESSVLDGAEDVMDHVVGLEMELSLAPLYEGQTLMMDMIDRMVGLGFRLAGVAPGFTDRATGETLQIDGTFFRD